MQVFAENPAQVLEIPKSPPGEETTVGSTPVELNYQDHCVCCKALVSDGMNNAVKLLEHCYSRTVSKAAVDECGGADDDPSNSENDHYGLLSFSGRIVLKESSKGDSWNI